MTSIISCLVTEPYLWRGIETVEALVTPSAHGSLWEMERDLIFKTLAK